MNLAALTEDVRMLPDQALQKELVQPSGLIPTYLVLGEVQRRQAMRQAAQAQQGQQSGSVYDDVIRNMMAKQPPSGQAPAPAGMTPPSSGQPSGPGAGPGATPPQNFKPPGMAGGGSVRYAKTPTDDEADDSDLEDIDPLITNLGQAIYRQEGSGPHTIATQQNNPGNLRSGPGQTGTANGYAVFPDMDTGFDALHKQIKKNIDRGLNLKEFFAGKPGVYAGYAPQVDKNHPDIYAQNVASWTGIDPDTPLQEQLQGAVSKDYTTLPAPTDDSAFTDSAPTGLAAITTVPAPPTPPPAPIIPAQSAPAPAPPSPHLQALQDQKDWYDREIATQNSLIQNTPNRNTPQNLQEITQAAQALLGVPPDYEMRKATIAQLQADALRRYQSQSPWDYLTNLAAGMAASRQVSLPMMFAQGAGYASQIQQQNREAALKDYDALAKEAETIDNNRDLARDRLGTTMSTLLSRQTQQDLMAQQRAQTRLDTLQKERTGIVEKMAPKPAAWSAEDAAILQSLGIDPNQPLTKEQAEAFYQKKKIGEIPKSLYSPEDTLVIQSLGFDPRKPLTPEQAAAALKKKKEGAAQGADLSDIDPNILELSSQLVKGQRNENLLKALPPAQQGILKSLVDYNLQLPTGVAITKGDWPRLLALAPLYDPSFNQSFYSTRVGIQKDARTGKMATQANALNTLTGHIEDWETNMKKLNNWGGLATWANAPRNFVREKMLGDPRIKPVLLNQENAANELMRLWRQVGASDAELARYAKVLDINSAPAEQQAVANEMYKAVNSKMAALKNQYESGMDKPNNFHMLTPEAIKRFQAHGVDPAELGPSTIYDASAITKAPWASFTTAHMLGPDGKYYDVPAENVEHAKQQGFVVP